MKKYMKNACFFEQIAEGCMRDLPEKRAIHPVCRLISCSGPGGAWLLCGVPVRARSYQTVMRVSSTQLGAVPSMVASPQVKPRTSSSLASHGKG
jgi:hypothetical protein